MSSVVVFMSHPVNIAPSSSVSIQAAASISRCLSSPLHASIGCSAAQTSLAPEKPVLKLACLISMPSASLEASVSAAVPLTYDQSRMPPLPGRDEDSGAAAAR